MGWFLVGVVVGLMIPAPYDAIARDAFGKAWATVKGWFNREQ